MGSKLLLLLLGVLLLTCGPNSVESGSHPMSSFNEARYGTPQAPIGLTQAQDWAFSKGWNFWKMWNFMSIQLVLDSVWYSWKDISRHEEQWFWKLSRAQGKSKRTIQRMLLVTEMLHTRASTLVVLLQWAMMCFTHWVIQCITTLFIATLYCVQRATLCPGWNLRLLPLVNPE